MSLVRRRRRIGRKTAGARLRSSCRVPRALAAPAFDCCASLRGAVRLRRLAGARAARTTGMGQRLARPYLDVISLPVLLQRVWAVPTLSLRSSGDTLMPTKFVITAAGAALLLAQPAFAHHPSGVGSTGGAGPINTIAASPLDQGEWAASIAFEWIKFDPLNNAFLANFGATHGHDVHVHSLSSIMAPAVSFGYGLTADFTISARLPVVVRTDIKEAAHEHDGGVTTGTVDFLGDSAGIGDLTLLGQYRFYHNRATRTEL